jgi:hypothetical protein
LGEHAKLVDFRQQLHYIVVDVQLWGCQMQLDHIRQKLQQTAGEEHG